MILMFVLLEVFTCLVSAMDDHYNPIPIKGMLKYVNRFLNKMGS